VLEHRLKRKPSRDLHRVFTSKTFSVPNGIRPRLARAWFNVPLMRLIYDAECHGIVPTVRNEAVIADASRDL